jgi:hypothetical protein
LLSSFHFTIGNQANKTGVASGAYHIILANISKPYLGELSRGRYERELVSNTEIFLEEIDWLDM